MVSSITRSEVASLISEEYSSEVLIGRLGQRCRCRGPGDCGGSVITHTPILPVRILMRGYDDPGIWTRLHAPANPYHGRRVRMRRELLRAKGDGTILHAWKRGPGLSPWKAHVEWDANSEVETVWLDWLGRSGVRWRRRGHHTSFRMGADQKVVSLSRRGKAHAHVDVCSLGSLATSWRPKRPRARRTASSITSWRSAFEGRLILPSGVHVNTASSVARTMKPSHCLFASRDTTI